MKEVSLRGNIAIIPNDTRTCTTNAGSVTVVSGAHVVVQNEAGIREQLQIFIVIRSSRASLKLVAPNVSTSNVAHNYKWVCPTIAACNKQCRRIKAIRTDSHVVIYGVRLQHLAGGRDPSPRGIPRMPDYERRPSECLTSTELRTSEKKNQQHIFFFKKKKSCFDATSKQYEPQPLDIYIYIYII